MQRSKILITSIYFYFILLLAGNSFGINLTSHYKQVSDDGTTYILYSFRCLKDNNKSCSLQALAIANDRAKNSCYIVYKTIFKNKTLQHNGDKLFIEVPRHKCDDKAIYIFYNNQIFTKFKNSHMNLVPVNDERCELFKVTKNQANLLSKEPTISQVGFGECKTFTFRMDD